MKVHIQWHNLQDGIFCKFLYGSARFRKHQISKPNLDHAILRSWSASSLCRIWHKTTSMAWSFAKMSTHFEIELLGAHCNDTSEQWVNELSIYFRSCTHYSYGHSALSPMYAPSASGHTVCTPNIRQCGRTPRHCFTFGFTSMLSYCAFRLFTLVIYTCTSFIAQRVTSMQATCTQFMVRNSLAGGHLCFVCL